MASTKLSRTAGTPTSNKTFTISYWVKRSNIGSAGNGHIFDTFVDSSNRSQIHFDDDNVIDFRLAVSGTNIGRLKTNRVFRDTSAWYHIVASVDTTLGTADDRVKLYINGVQETSFSTRVNPSINADFPMGGTHTLGAYGGGSNYFDGTLSHFHFTDGYAYTPSTFGESDSTSGIWKPKTAPSVTYGTNGFFLKFENSGAMGTDSSGNSNTFTVSGTLTQNVDTPSNNYATFNPLVGYSNGNYVGTSRANTRAGINFGTTSTTLIPNKGKWFIEYHFQNASSNTDAGVGGWSINTSQVYGYGSAGFKGIVWKYAGNVYVDGTNNVVASDTYTNGDIISIAINYDDDLITFYKNGSTATNLINYSYSFSNYSDFSTGILDGASSSTYDENFDLNAGQNPTFGGRKTAGTYADANGHGLFSMAVPSGYYAINTKNIKEFG